MSNTIETFTFDKTKCFMFSCYTHPSIERPHQKIEKSNTSTCVEIKNIQMCDKQTMIKCRVEQYSLCIAKYIDIIRKSWDTAPRAIRRISLDIILAIQCFLFDVKSNHISRDMQAKHCHDLYPTNGVLRGIGVNLWIFVFVCLTLAFKSITSYW